MVFDQPIRLTRHLEFRLGLRKMDRALPEYVIRHADRLFLDTLTRYQIAVAESTYDGRPHLMMVAFEETKLEITAITAHPLSPFDVEAKIRSGRWRPRP